MKKLNPNGNSVLGTKYTGEVIKTSFGEYHAHTHFYYIRKKLKSKHKTFKDTREMFL